MDALIILSWPLVLGTVAALLAFREGRRRDMVRLGRYQLESAHAKLGRLGTARHLDSHDNSCYEYGCTNDCPIGGHR